MLDCFDYRHLSSLVLTTGYSRQVGESRSFLCRFLTKTARDMSKRCVVNETVKFCFRLPLVSWHLLSQRSVATHLRCIIIFIGYFITRLFLSQTVRRWKKTLNSGKHLAKLWTKVRCPFYPRDVVSGSLLRQRVRPSVCPSIRPSQPVLCLND